MKHNPPEPGVGVMSPVPVLRGLGKMIVNLRPACVAQQNPVSEKEKGLVEAQ